MHSVAQAKNWGGCLNFNATLEPWKLRPVRRLLMAFPHSSSHSILVLEYTGKPHQGWASTHRRLNPCGGQGRGCRASKPSQDHDICILFQDYLQKRSKITCAPKVGLEYNTADGWWKSFGGPSSQHWKECHKIPGRAQSLSFLCVSSEPLYIIYWFRQL